MKRTIWHLLIGSGASKRRDSRPEHRRTDMDTLVTQVHAQRITNPAGDDLPLWEVSVMIVGGVTTTARARTRWLAETKCMMQLQNGEFSDEGLRAV